MGREFRVTIDKDEFRVRVDKVKHGVYRVELNGKQAVVSVEEVAEKIIAPESIPVAKTGIERPKGTEKVEQMQPGRIFAMLPGTVVKIFINEGDHVKPGQPILVLEAMKMENEIMSPKGGVVKMLNVRKGEKVEVGDLLAIIE